VVLATPEHPLVVFLDDLQWADATTIQLLLPLLTNPDLRSVFVIGAYRDNEVRDYPEIWIGKKIDLKDHHHVFEAWLAEHQSGWRLAITMPPAGTKGCTPLAKCWVVERTNAWHGRYRRNSKDDERQGASRTAMLHISHMHLMLNQLVPCSSPAFHYRKEAA
jgi:transposase